MTTRLPIPLVAVLLLATPAFAAGRRTTTPTTTAPAAAPAVAPAAPSPPELAAPSLDFDLLAPATALPAPDPAQVALDASLAKRRRMLTLHQTLGIGLVASMAGTMLTGQLNYNDRYGEAQSGRWELSHRLFAYTTLATFTATGAMALFAPVPPGRELRADRVLLHRIGLAGATVGMVTQAVLGIMTAHSNGLARQQSLAQAHLAVGWATLGFMTLGVGAIVF